MKPVYRVLVPVVAPLLLAYAFLCTVMVRYDLLHIFHTHVPLVAEFVLGLVLSECLPVVTLVVWILVMCGVLA